MDRKNRIKFINSQSLNHSNFRPPQGKRINAFQIHPILFGISINVVAKPYRTNLEHFISEIYLVWFGSNTFLITIRIKSWILFIFHVLPPTFCTYTSIQRIFASFGVPFFVLWSEQSTSTSQSLYALAKFPFYLHFKQIGYSREYNVGSTMKYTQIPMLAESEALAACWHRSKLCGRRWQFHACFNSFLTTADACMCLRVVYWSANWRQTVK